MKLGNISKVCERINESIALKMWDTKKYFGLPVKLTFQEQQHGCNHEDVKCNIKII